VYIFHALKRSEREKMKMEQAEISQTPTAGSAGAGNGPGEEAQESPSASGASPATEDIADLKAQAAKAKEHWDLLLRTTADFDNFKKRAARERQDAIRYANESLLQKLIPVLDSFDMAANATANTNATEGASQSLQAGVAMILTQLRTALAEGGLEEIDATGKAFDPNFHEAVAQQEAADVPEGHVVQQLRKGYKLRDRLLRPATVVVAKPAA
jgi:molecular chaperone GrpE